jgi:hypothetical protein
VYRPMIDIVPVSGRHCLAAARSAAGAEAVATCLTVWQRRAGALPALELYMTLERQVVEREFIGEQSVDGMEFSAAAYFRR